MATASVAEIQVTKRQEIARISAAFLLGKIDPLDVCRRIVGLVGEADRGDADIVTIAGIESETDHFPGPEQRKLWEPAFLAEQDAEREAYFKQAGPWLREACVHLEGKWRDA